MCVALTCDRACGVCLCVRLTGCFWCVPVSVCECIGKDTLRKVKLTSVVLCCTQECLRLVCVQGVQYLCVCGTVSR